MKRQSISTTQLAEICGVSQGTVDRALNDRPGINPETKQKILTAAKAYGYRPNIHARSMAGGKSMLIGVVVFDLNNPFFPDVLNSITKYCSDRNYSTVVMVTDRDPEREIQCIQNLYHMAVDGIVLYPVGTGESYERFLQSLEIPVVTIGNRLENIPYAGIDNYRAMADAVQYAIEQGYEHLVYVKPSLKGSNTFAQDERLRAFMENASKITCAVTDIAGTEDALQPGKKNAWICPSDILAVRLLQKAQEKGVGLLGFDNIRLIDSMGLSLDSVSYDIGLTAKQVADHIIDGAPIDQPIPHRIVKRGSI